jgi:hypothetical protein
VAWHKVYSALEIYQVYCDQNGAIYTFGKCRYDNDITVVKHTIDGSIIWAKKYDLSIWGGPMTVFAPEGELVIAANSCSLATSTLWGVPIILTLNRDGDILWAKYYNGFNYGYYGKLTSCKKDGGGYIASTNASQIIKFNSAGEILWVKQLETPEGSNVNIPNVHRVIHPVEGGYLFGGKNSDDLWIAMLSTNGELIWEYKYEAEYSIDIRELLTTNNGVVLIANTKSFGVSGETITEKIWIAPINPSNGNLIWQKVFDLPGNDSVYSAFLNDKGFVLTGTYDDQSIDAMVVSIDPDGNFPDYSGKYQVRNTEVVPSVFITDVRDITANIEMFDFTLTYEDYEVNQKSAESTVTYY